MVPLLPKLFGTSGVRGVFPDRVNPELMIRVGRAIAQYFNRSSLVVGHDARTSSKALSLALTSSLISSGASVVDLGLTPIGVLAWSVKKFNLGGGIYITASHNPPQYNGFKVFKRGGVEITTVDEEIIEENLDRASYASWSELGRYSTL
ncbi:MAG: phosphoglucosamine mutase, partial [Sulfolobales archaeon]